MFTFDTERPPANVVAILGGAGQRWFTAFGDYSGDTAVLSAELTSGGIFDSPEPMPEQTADYGTVTLTFVDCNTLILAYEFPGLGLSGEIVMGRIANDNVPLCEELAQMGS